MKKLFLLTLLMTVFLMSVTVYAQDELGGSPFSFSAKKLSMNVPQMHLPSVDHAALVAEDEINGKNRPLRISVHQPLYYTMENSGRLDILSDGSKLWRLNIKSPNAYAVYLLFSTFEIPEGAELFVYTPDQKHVRGKYTEKKEGEEFIVLDLPGDEVVVEYYEPAGAEFAGNFEISYLGHNYRDAFVSKGHWGDAEGTCHINVNCPEAQQLWQNQINSVVCIRMVSPRGTYLCSGAMVNNARQDGTPYVYTAAHCFTENAEWFFYFDYQTYACSASTGSNGYATRNCEIRAYDSEGGSNASSGPDFMLLEITGEIPPAVVDHLYFAGWDLSTSTPTVGAAIHHPGGDFKKYSKPKRYSSYNYYSGRYWEVGWYDVALQKGVTEGGSSGSPLFNGNGLIVGSLSRGTSACDDDPRTAFDETKGTDIYGKISASWTFNSNTSKQLKHWLDPGNTGTTQLEGEFYKRLVGVEENKNAKNSFVTNIYPNPTQGVVKIEGDFNGEQIQCNIYNLLGTLVYQESTIVNRGFELNLDLENGIYFLELQGKEKKATHKLVISK